MEKVFNKTVNALTRFGDQIERHFVPDGRARSKSGIMFGNPAMQYNYPMDRRMPAANMYAARPRNLNYGSVRKLPGNNFAPGPESASYGNFRPNMMHRSPNGRIDKALYANNSNTALNYGYGSNNNSFSGGYGSLSGGYNSYSGSPGEVGCCPPPVNVGCAPNYYVAERRQIELIPAPPPQIIHQQVPCPYPVDRPVPVPCPVAVPVPVPCERQVPYPVPVPVPCDRPVPVPVPVCVPSPPPPPVCIPVPVPVPQPCAVPVPQPCAVPVPCMVPCCCPQPCCCPSQCPPPCGQQMPYVLEQSVTHNQRWLNNATSLISNPYGGQGNGSFMM